MHGGLRVMRSHLPGSLDYLHEAIHHGDDDTEFEGGVEGELLAFMVRVAEMGRTVTVFFGYSDSWSWLGRMD